MLTLGYVHENYIQHAGDLIHYVPVHTATHSAAAMLVYNTMSTARAELLL